MTLQHRFRLSILDALGRTIAVEITGSCKPQKSGKVAVVCLKGPFHIAVHGFVALFTCVLHFQLCNVGFVDIIFCKGQ